MILKPRRLTGPISFGVRSAISGQCPIAPINIQRRSPQELISQHLWLLTQVCGLSLIMSWWGKLLFYHRASWYQYFVLLFSLAWVGYSTVDTLAELYDHLLESHMPSCLLLIIFQVINFTEMIALSTTAKQLITYDMIHIGKGISNFFCSLFDITSTILCHAKQLPISVFIAPCLWLSAL